MPKVTVYTTSWCAFCRAEKQWLDEHKVPYQSIDVETDETAAHDMIHASGQTGVPVTVIKPEDPAAAPVVIVGFDQERLAHELNLPIH